jgi:hypothetical protein
MTFLIGYLDSYGLIDPSAALEQLEYLMSEIDGQRQTIIGTK